MSYNGSGTFSINSSGQPVVTGTVISSTAFNALTADLATGLSTAITKDGQTTTTARVPFAQGISSTLVTDATSATTGSIVTAGGISCQKAAVVGTSLTFNGFAAEGTVTAASTTDLSTSIANRQSVTGNTTITSFGSGANYYRILRFTGTPLLTYNATTLITPTGANIQAAPGDIAMLTSDGSGNWTIVSYAPFGGILSANRTSSISILPTAQIATITLTPGKWFVSGAMSLNGGSPSWVQAGIGSTTASFTGAVFGLSLFQSGVGVSATATIPIPGFFVTVTANTPYYLNGSTDGSAGTAIGSISAQRVF